MTTRGIKEPLIKYLTYVHTMEERALGRLDKAPNVDEIPELAQALRADREQTQHHEMLIRDCLRAYRAEPWGTKDTRTRTPDPSSVFTHMRPRAPSKLAAHFYCYKHLELAAYDLLERVAQHTQDAETARIAQRIGREEQAIADRLAELLDSSVDTDLAQPSEADLQSNLLERLADAHATEEESVALLNSACNIVARGRLWHIFEDHRAQSEVHRRLVEDRLQAYGAKPSAVKGAAARSSALRCGLSLRAQPDASGKLVPFVFGLEHLEIASYQQLVRVAARAGDADTLGVVQCILIDEQTAAAALKRTFDAALVGSLGAEDVSPGHRGVSIDSLGQGQEHR
jgi:ferritin-like metal-binding protein YciE